MIGIVIVLAVAGGAPIMRHRYTILDEEGAPERVFQTRPWLAEGSFGVGVEFL